MGNLGEGDNDLGLCSLFLLLRAQKKKQEKGTPASPGPAGFPCFSTKAERKKKLGLCPQAVFASFSAPVCEARQAKWGSPICTQKKKDKTTEKGSQSSPEIPDGSKSR